MRSIRVGFAATVVAAAGIAVAACGSSTCTSPSALTGQAKTKPWVSLDINKAVQDKFGASLSQLGGGTNDPSQTLSYLRGVGSDVKNDGPATVDGTATTHYTATMSVNAPATKQHLSQDTVATMEKAIGKTMTMQLWIDGQNRLRQMSCDQTINPGALGGPGASDVGPITANMTMKLSDFGTPVNVTAPPADQVTALN